MKAEDHHDEPLNPKLKVSEKKEEADHYSHNAFGQAVQFFYFRNSIP